MASEFLASLLKWIREPASWLALAAASVSVATFILVYAYPGELRVVPPDRVGLHYLGSDRRLEMLLPLTFTNTGAPRTWRHVLRVTAVLATDGRRPEGTRDPALAWEYEDAFVGKREWLAKNPGADQGTVDYLTYVGRALPFSLAGGVSQAKLYRLLQYDGTPSGKALEKFTLVISVLQEDGRVEVARKYACREEVTDDRFTWCPLDPGES